MLDSVRTSHGLRPRASRSRTTAADRAHGHCPLRSAVRISLRSRADSSETAAGAHPADQALVLLVVAAARRPATCAPMGTAAHVSGRGTCARRDRASRPSLAATVDCISGQAARTRARFAKLFVPTGGAVGAGNCGGSLAACRALAPACQTCTWLAMHASTAETCRAAGDRCSTWRREVNSERASWAPLTCTCGSGCCAPSDPPHAIATKIAPRLLTVHSG